MSTTLKVKLNILRRESAEAESYWQSVLYETDNLAETVANALTKINAGDYQDANGEPVAHINWQCSCLQKKCGACAMVINGKPGLACDAFLRDFKKEITIEPLRKFPVVKDLIVDRSIMYENLKTMELWTTSDVTFTDKLSDTAYEGSRCLQCGCCLEVCPNFAPGDDFFGAAAFVPTTRLLNSLSEGDVARLKNIYQNHIYKDCGKSLACKSICPAGIDTEHLLVRGNKVAVFKRG